MTQSTQLHQSHPRPTGRRRRMLIVPTALLVTATLPLANAVVVSSQSADASAPSVLSVDGENLNVRQDGPADAPALLLIHGLGGSTRWWDPVVPTLARSYRVIRVDLLGFGRSAKPAGAGYEIPDQGRLTAAVLDRLGVKHVVVVGHSTGGSVATALAEQRPDLVDAMALVDAGPSRDAFIPQGPAGTLATAPVVGQLLWRLRTDRLIRRSMATGFSRRGFEIPQDLVDDARVTTFHAFSATSKESGEYLRRRTLPDRLERLGKPLLVIFGRDDRRWRSASAEDYRKVPGARIEVLPGVGHSPMQEDPAHTADLLVSFLDSVVDSAPRS